MSDSSIGANWKIWLRLTNGELTLKNGFSVVAPTSSTSPASTSGSSTSCWLRLNRWISSRNNTVRFPPWLSRSRAPSSTARTSLMPTAAAFSCSKWACVVPAISRASVVFPVPGGP